MTRLRLILLCLLLADIAYGLGFAFDRWMHRPIEIHFVSGSGETI